jgi:hypothetical protein
LIDAAIGKKTTQAAEGPKKERKKPNSAGCDKQIPHQSLTIAMLRSSSSSACIPTPPLLQRAENVRCSPHDQQLMIVLIDRQIEAVSAMMLL